MNDKQKEIFDRIAEIKDRMEDAKCELALLRQACEQLKQERNEAIQRAEKAENALKQLEWSGYRTHDLRQCPVCFSLKREGIHSKDCFIAKALYPDWYPNAIEQKAGELTIKKGNQ